MGLAFIPLYIKFLGIEAYGLIGLFALLQVWLSLLDMGMTPTLSREMARFSGGSHTAGSIRDLLRSIEIIALVIAIFIACGIALCSDWLASSWLKANGLPVDEVAKAFAIMGMVTALRFVEGVYRSSILGLQRQVLFNVVNSISATLRGFGAVVILGLVSPTIQAFFLWQGLISVITLAILARMTYTNLPRADRAGRFSLDALRKIWRFAGGMIGITFLSLLLTQVDKILLSKLLALSEYGYYTLAAVVAGAMYMLVSPITQAWFPRLSQLHAGRDHAGLVRTYHQGAQLVSVVLGSAALMLIVFSETFLHLWTQDAALAHRTAPLLSLLTLGNLLNGLCWMPYQAQLAYGWTGLGMRINSVAVFIIVPAILWVTPRYGAEGATWVWVSLNVGYLLIGIHFMHRQILRTEKWHWYRQDILQPLLAASAMPLLIHWLLPTPTSVIPQIATLALASVLTLTAAGLAAKQVRQQARTAITTFIAAIPIKSL